MGPALQPARVGQVRSEGDDGELVGGHAIVRCRRLRRLVRGVDEQCLSSGRPPTTPGRPQRPVTVNVLRVQMSLVGPRPPLPHEAATFGMDVRRRLLVKPGMTGLWQINGRSDLSWEESVRLDLYYVENSSVMSDHMILWRTGRAVRRASSAY